MPFYHLRFEMAALAQPAGAEAAPRRLLRQVARALAPGRHLLGSLRQFGLIEGMGERTRISDLALAIVQPASEKERIEGVRQAARNPEVFRLIYDRFGGQVPNADEPIKAYLIRELGFSKRGADECLNTLRKTLRTLEELTGDAGFESSESTQESDADLDSQASENIQERKSYQTASSEGEFIRIPLLASASPNYVSMAPYPNEPY